MDSVANKKVVRGNLLIETFDGKLYEDDDVSIHYFQMLKHGIKPEQIRKTGFRVEGGGIVWNQDFTNDSVGSGENGRGASDEVFDY